MTTVLKLIGQFAIQVALAYAAIDIAERDYPRLMRWLDRRYNRKVHFPAVRKHRAH